MSRQPIQHSCYKSLAPCGNPPCTPAHPRLLCPPDLNCSCIFRMDAIRTANTSLSVVTVGLPQRLVPEVVRFKQLAQFPCLLRAGDFFYVDLRDSLGLVFEDNHYLFAHFSPRPGRQCQPAEPAIVGWPFPPLHLDTDHPGPMAKRPDATRNIVLRQTMFPVFAQILAQIPNHRLAIGQRWLKLMPTETVQLKTAVKGYWLDAPALTCAGKLRSRVLPIKKLVLLSRNFCNPAVASSSPAITWSVLPTTPAPVTSKLDVNFGNQ